MLHIWNPGGGRWGEGDNKFFVDGEKFPSSFGIGSEDCFGYAWSSPILFQHALHNQTHNDGDSKGHVSVKRWDIADAVPFHQSFQGCNLPIGVVLGVFGLVPGNSMLSVSGVQGPGGTSVSSQIPVLARLGPALNVVANQYQQGRAAALSRSTDGIVQHDANVTTWTTFGGVTGLSDFVGLTYAEPQVFSALKVDLGYQFVDGGDWGSLPRVYILTHPLDTNQRAPVNDPANYCSMSRRLL